MNDYLPLVIILGTALAIANGANDVSKGIATLVGSGVADLRRAVAWGTVWTGAGAMAAMAASRAMIATFGAGLFGVGVHPTAAAAVAILAGAALWVGLSTWSGWPVATTHAIVGALAGVGAVAYGRFGVRWSVLGEKVMVPLVVSPLLAWGITRLLLLLLLRQAHTAPQACGADCQSEAPEPPLRAVTAVAAPPSPVRGAAAPPRLASRIGLDGLHWLSSGATSFARGLNDAPKMVALLLGAAAVSRGHADPTPAFFAAVAAGIMIGSWLAGRKVTLVLAHDVTLMTHREGLIANLVTATLVGPGAALGLPMSTTQVASGAIFGLGNGGLNRRTVSGIIFAWAATLPGAALLGIAVLFGLHGLGMQ